MRLLELQTLSHIRQVIVYNGNCLRQPLIAKMAGHQGCKDGRPSGVQRWSAIRGAKMVGHQGCKDGRPSGVQRWPAIRGAKMVGHQGCKERQKPQKLLLSSLHFTSLLEMATCLIAVEGNGSHWF